MLRHLRLSIVLVRALAGCLLVVAAMPAGAEQPIKEFYFSQLKSDQGLSGGIVTGILRDRSGYLWMTTLNGLNCFDGSHFLVWKADLSDSNKLFNDALYTLCEDKAGNIWCASNAGVSRYDRKTDRFRNYILMNPVTGRRSLSSSNGVLCSRKGIIATYSYDGIYLYDPKKDSFVLYPELKKEGALDCDGVYNHSFLEDTWLDGIWIGTDKGLKFFDLATRTFHNAKFNPDHRPVINDHSSGPLALDADGNLVVYDNVDQVFITYTSRTGKSEVIHTKGWHDKPLKLKSFLVDRQGNFWLSSHLNTALFREKKSGKVYRMCHLPGSPHSLAADFFNVSYRDQRGTIYFGTVNGISYIDPERSFISVFAFPDSVEVTRRYYLNQLLSADINGNIWFAPEYKTLLEYNAREGTYHEYDILKGRTQANTDGIHITAMQGDSTHLYFGTTHGIFVFDLASRQFNRLKTLEKEPLEGRYIIKMLMTSGGDLWFTSHHNGIYCYHTRTGTYEHYVHDSTDARSFTSQYIFDLAESTDGNIWICAEQDGLLGFHRKDKKFDYFTRDPSGRMPGDYFSITSGPGNSLWLMGLLNGLSRFDIASHTMHRIHFEGMANFQYNHLLADNQGRIWLSYYAQYTMIDPATKVVRNFQVEQGKSDNDYTNYSCLLPDGKVVTETRNGFLLFDPEYIMDSRPLEPVTVSGFRSGSMQRSFLPGERISLKSNQNFFSIDFSTLSLLHGRDVEFAYMLEGLNDEWITAGKRQTAYFTNISGGDYMFRVRASMPNGAWQEATFPVPISVAKVFYVTTWFRILLAIAIVACCAWYLRMIRRRNIRKEAEKSISYFAYSQQGKSRIDELLWDITHHVISRTDLVDCVVYLLDERRKVLVQKAAYGNKNPEEQEIMNPLEIPLGKGIVGSVALSGKPEMIGDTSKDARYIADDVRRFSELCVPIVAEGKVLGVIDSEHPRKNFFTRTHANLLHTIASIAATKILKAQKEQEVEEGRQRLQELKVQVAETRQQALQSQMNPHFIFNCLNSINGFILQNDAATASTFLIKFSKLIRMILEHSNEKTISLQSELDALILYIDMEKLRFDKKFTCTLDIAPDVMTDTIQVPPLILQPFVENSIWHGLLHKDSEGHLSIRIRHRDNRLECTIEDDGIGRAASASLKSPSATHKKSLGLKLTNERLALLNSNGSSGSFVAVTDLVDAAGEACGTRAVIALPLAPEEQ